MNQTTTIQNQIKNQCRKEKRQQTEYEKSIGKRAEQGEKEAADDPRPEHLQQQLTPGQQVGGSSEHLIPIHHLEEQVPHRRLRARQESVRLLAAAAGPPAAEAEEAAIAAASDTVGDECGIRRGQGLGKGGAGEGEEAPEKGSVFGFSGGKSVWG